MDQARARRIGVLEALEREHERRRVAERRRPGQLNPCCNRARAASGVSSTSAWLLGRTRRRAAASNSDHDLPTLPIRAASCWRSRPADPSSSSSRFCASARAHPTARQRPLARRGPAAQRQRAARRRVAHQRPHQLGPPRALAPRQQHQRRRPGRRALERALQPLGSPRRARTAAAGTAAAAGPSARARTRRFGHPASVRQAALEGRQQPARAD